MKTVSAERLYQEHFLRIAELSLHPKKSALAIVKKPELAPVVPIAPPVQNPANWDEGWFANYE